MTHDQPPLCCAQKIANEGASILRCGVLVCTSYVHAGLSVRAG